MTKKEYMKPEIEVVKSQQQSQILAGSQQGLNDELNPDPVDDGWAPGMFDGPEWDALLQ